MKKPHKILVIDDDDDVLTSARFLLKQHYQLIQTINHPSKVNDLLKEITFDLILMDMNFTVGEQEGNEGLQLIHSIKQNYPSIELIAITAYGDMQIAVESMKLGVRDFISKPWENERLLLTIENTLSYQSVKNELNLIRDNNKLLSQHYLGFQEPIGNHPSFVRCLQVAQRVATTDAEVLITGENGTGKEVLARFIHYLSDRKNGPFIHIDMGAISNSLFESELFGHKRGAFTDAHSDRIGKMVTAHGGTIFLDEIGNIPGHLQAKLLMALQQKKITPVGSNESIAVDVRIIAATNIDLYAAISNQSFRQDLLYRINTIEIQLPSLRERESDITLLATHFLEVFKKKYNKTNLRLSKRALDRLTQYPWPGNIRELSHSIERAVILQSDELLQPDHFHLTNETILAENLNLLENEKSLIIKALEKNNGNITHASKSLGIDRLALYRRMEKYGL